ncbi:MAG: NAD(P) transhydrogenase subunit alpha [Sporichthyaceae bacterium]|nr:NAD(P) transhydrogenase subunit alpha [Sporichthyaceae bacterium]
MQVAVPAETRPGERRVALVPDAVPRLVQAGLVVTVEAGAGLAAYASDRAYADAGAEVRRGPVIDDADVVLSVRALDPVQVARHVRPGTVTISLLQPAAELDAIVALRDRQATSFSLDLLPRISRAQSMDALSSQALVAGYRAVLIAADRLPRFFPLAMTAAGTIPPAVVLVLGAGVAGLQAIATARRLGGVVEAYDVRAAAADEVRSLGARFVELELETQEGSGGYAKVASEEFLARQRELIGRHVAAADVVITTAAVPGRTAPVLVTRGMVEAMRPGAVVVDLAAETGGNCELSVAGEEIMHGGVLVHGARDIASSMPDHASRLYARNVSELLLLLHGGAAHGATAAPPLVPDFGDEVVAGCCVTYGGAVRHEPTAALLADPGGGPA